MMRKEIEKLNFESTEMPDLWAPTGNSSFRLTAEDFAEMPDDTKDLDTLKIRLSDLFYERIGSYGKLEAFCDIKQDTFSKAVRLKNGRNITYTFLAKFCVGAGLSEDEANELFLLMGHNLNPKNRYDFILLRELKRKTDISGYNADLISCGYPGILSNAD